MKKKIERWVDMVGWPAELAQGCSTCLFLFFFSLVLFHNF
jgi:hypothetical protein